MLYLLDMLVKPFIAVLVLYSDEVVVLVLGEHHILGGHGHAWALLWLEHVPSVSHAIGPRQLSEYNRKRIAMKFNFL